MKLLWTLLKVTLALVLIVPVGIILMATMLGIFGALLGIAMLTLRLAVMGLVAYGAFRLVAWLFRDRAPRPAPKQPAPLPPVDPYYQAAMRELDRDVPVRP